VAIKVPRRNRRFLPQDLEAYLREARLVAGLDHSAIVPVYDVGRTEDGFPYVVSKFIEGCNLAERMRIGPVSHDMAIAWIAVVSEALHYVHTRGLVHRDIKPGNILIDASDRPFLTDFGLALTESDFGKEGPVAGTLGYLSPEQARGEGHLVDGRADIFSLGVVLYELITETTPFQGEDTTDVIRHILSLEAKPPRQIDDSIPIELERICLKAISKRVVDRYSTALDFAHDLHHLLQGTGENGSSARDASSVSASGAIVPRGLRSFEAEDADFFLELLPGPRDGEGLPRPVRFWKSRLESTDPDETFRVGLMYGPSGSGKSSLVKAGILPRLESTVLPVFLESTSAELEARLLNKIRARLPGLPVEHGLTEALSGIRRGGFLPAGRKLLVVLDQFEQWLHAWIPGAGGGLVSALRQCDGNRVQCLLLVRDDFWLGATRFLWELDAPLVEGGNALAVDLFERRARPCRSRSLRQGLRGIPPRARSTRSGSGGLPRRGHRGALERGRGEPGPPRVVHGDVQEPGLVRRLPASGGGADGVGTRFLEETFHGGMASPDHRMHRQAAQAVLQTLLPERESNLRGRAQSREQLQEASGYGRRTREFDDLLRILVSEIRLLTLVDPVADSDGGSSGEPVEVAGAPRYQLTHDYLVPSIREWLSREQRRTRRGRLERQLADRASLWKERPERKQLPSPWEWLNIVLFTRRQRWTDVQRRMIRSAGLQHTVSTAVAVVLVAVLAVGGLQIWGGLKAQTLVDRLFDAQMEEVPRVVAAMEPLRSRVDPLLAVKASNPSLEDGKKVRLALAGLPQDAGQVPLLEKRMLEAAPAEFEVLRQALLPHAEDISSRMWKILDEGTASGERRLRAAGALAAFDPRDERWSARADEFVPILLAENPLNVSRWIELFRPVRESLIPSLKKAFAPESRTRETAALILSEYLESAQDVASLGLEGTPASSTCSRHASGGMRTPSPTS
jgi:serine/threonine protein kinase